MHLFSRFRVPLIGQVKAVTGSCIPTRATCSRTVASCGDRSGSSVRGRRHSYKETVSLRRPVLLGPTSTGHRLVVPRPRPTTRIRRGRTQRRSSAKMTSGNPSWINLRPNCCRRYQRTAPQLNETPAFFR